MAKQQTRELQDLRGCHLRGPRPPELGGDRYRTTHLVLRKADTQNVGVRGSESFIDRDQIDLAGWTGPSVLKGLGNGGQVCASAGGGVLVGESWNLAIYGTGPSAPRLPGQWTLSFRKGLGVRVPVTFQSSGSRDFGFKRSWRPKFSPVLALAA